MQTWKDGADRLYNNAKSIMSEISRSPSELSRSRAQSKEYIFPTKSKSPLPEFEAAESDEEQSFKEPPAAPAQPVTKPLFGLKPEATGVVGFSPAFGQSTNQQQAPELTDKVDTTNKSIVTPIAVKPAFVPPAPPKPAEAPLEVAKPVISVPVEAPKVNLFSG